MPYAGVLLLWDDLRLAVVLVGVSVVSTTGQVPGDR